MDDRRNATELVTALRTYLNETATRDGDRWRSDDDADRLVRVDDATLALLFGEPGLVGNLSVAGADGELTVTDLRSSDAAATLYRRPASGEPPEAPPSRGWRP
jgi:hypothetical protein